MKFLFFWSHQPRRDGSVGTGCLSQWWPAPFILDGTTFATTEHYMMWRKATLFDDARTAERILAAPHPHAAKTLGAQVAGFDQRTWDAHRYDIVMAGNLAKFGQHPELGTFLLGTGKRVLVEASPADRIWDIGLAADDPRAGDPAQWRGLNLLGFALMDVRSILETNARTVSGFQFLPCRGLPATQQVSGTSPRPWLTATIGRRCATAALAPVGVDQTTR